MNYVLPNKIYDHQLVGQPHWSNFDPFNQVIKDLNDKFMTNERVDWFAN